MYDRYSNGKDKTGYYLQGGFPIEAAAFVANQYCKKGIDGILSYDGSNGIALGLDEVGREPKVKALRDRDGCDTVHTSNEIRQQEKLYNIRDY